MAKHSKDNPMLFVTGATAIGGAEIDLLHLVRYLKEHEVAFILACPDHGPFYDRVKGEGLQTIPIKLGASFGRWRGLNIFSPTTYVQLYRFYKVVKPIVRKHDIKLIFAQQELKEKLFAAFVGQMLGLRVAWAEHGMFHPWVKSTPVRFLYSLVAKRFVSVIICPAQAVRTQLSGFGISGDKIAVIHNGVPQVEATSSSSSIRNEFGLTDEQIVVTTVTRLFYRKGVQDLVRAVAKIKQQLPNLRLLIVGDGRYRPDLEKLASELSVTDSIVFAGFRAEPASLVMASDIFINPSFDSEGMPLAILEAMSAQKPVVAASVGGVAECVTDDVTGLLVPPRDVDAMADAIKALVLDRDLRERLGSAGYESFLENFQVDHMCERTMRLLAELSGSS